MLLSKICLEYIFWMFPLLAAEAGHDVCLRFNFIPNALTRSCEASQRARFAHSRKACIFLVAPIN